MEEKGPIWKLDADDIDIPTSSTVGNTVKPVPTIKDVIGASLKYVGPYKKLDNKKQVVALIDDVSIIIEFFFFIKRICVSEIDFIVFFFVFVGSLYKLWQMLHGMCRFWLSSH